MKSILAPTDFSPVSINAVKYAADMAVAIKSSLVIMYVSPIPLATEIPYPPDLLTHSIKEAEEKLEALKQEISAGKDLKIYTEVKAGMILSEIKALSETLKPFAVVMGTQGSGAIERFIFGSNTLSAIKQLSSPLLIIHPDTHFKNMKQIGLACDLRKVGETCPVDEIKFLVKQFNATLQVIHVNRESEGPYGPDIIDQSGSLQALLADLHPRYHFLNNTPVDEGLISFAERNNLDLLIVVPKKHNIISSIFHKSHSKQVVMNAHMPVMALHE